MPTILLKKSDTASAVPTTANLTNLAGGVEVAVNTADRRMFTMNSSSAVVELGNNPTSLNITTGNLAFTGTGQRITGDMSNATVSSRLYFQNSVTNGATSIGALPNGTSPNSGINLFNNSDPTNAAFAGILVGSTEAQFRSAITGTGTYLPMTFYTGGSERMRLDTSGFLGLGTASPNITGFASSTSAMTIKGSSSNGRGAIELASNGTTGNGNSLGDIYFYDNTSLNARITGARDTSTTTGYLAFFTNGGSGNTERMRIDSSGNVGIGKTASTNKLEVSGTISDVAGNVRAIPRTGSEKTSAYTLAITDVGQFVQVGTSGSVTVPNDTFATGDVVSVFNNTTGNISINCPITTAYLSGTNTDRASLTLATRGVATILFINPSLCVASGNLT